MAEKNISKVVYGGKTLIDLTSDTVTADKLLSGVIALDQQGADAAIAWTTADDNDVTVKAADLRAVIAAVAMRSNALHVKYRTLKHQVQECKTMEELEAIKWE